MPRTCTAPLETPAGKIFAVPSNEVGQAAGELRFRRPAACLRLATKQEKRRTGDRRRCQDFRRRDAPKQKLPGGFPKSGKAAQAVGARGGGQ